VGSGHRRNLALNAFLVRLSWVSPGCQTSWVSDLGTSFFVVGVRHHGTGAASFDEESEEPFPPGGCSQGQP
jgi:hypothetical protein